MSAVASTASMRAMICRKCEAKDSQILIDGKVCAAVEEIAELEPLQDLKLKGFHRPIKAANVRAISARRAEIYQTRDQGLYQAQRDAGRTACRYELFRLVTRKRSRSSI